MSYEEMIEKTEAELERALSDGVLQFGDTDSERFIDLFSRAVSVLRSNRENEGLFKALVIQLGFFRFFETLLRVCHLTWDGDLVLERAKEVLREEMRHCPHCSAGERCPIFLLVRAFNGPVPEEILNLSVELKFYTGGMVAALKDRARSGTGVVTIWAGGSNKNNLN